MAEPAAQALRFLIAELDAEMQRVARTVAEIAEAQRQIEEPGASRVIVYGAAALLVTFYTGVEKTLVRIAKRFGTPPDGPSWHRELLEASTLDIQGMRPAVLRIDTAKALDTYPCFRHRFHNLYLFDLDIDLTRPLLSGAGAVWVQTSADLQAFSGTLRSIGQPSRRSPRGAWTLARWLP